ncbi:MAG: 5-bromo-4-chloroindolyl phosphate hydrolysis family protein [Clostridia bacterium]|nr:5-bromo-4-chloroindolyl phosphate hydrolysis family protein [Clostridia bacterium]
MAINSGNSKKDNSLRNAIIAFGVTLFGYAALPFTSFHKLSDFLLGGGIALLVSTLIKTMTTPMKGLEAPSRSDGIMPDQVQDEYARSMVVKGLELLEELRNQRDAINEYVFTRRLNELAEGYAELLNRVVADHNKATHLRKLNSYYLPTAIKLLQSYRDAKGQDTSYMEISATREDILKMLEQIISALKTLKKKMVKSNLETIDIKIEVLEDILRADGYIEDAETGELRQSAERAAAQMSMAQQMRGPAVPQAVPVQSAVPARQPAPAPKAVPVQQPAPLQPAVRLDPTVNPYTTTAVPTLKANVPTASAQQLQQGAPVLHVPGLTEQPDDSQQDDAMIHF